MLTESDRLNEPKSKSVLRIQDAFCGAEGSRTPVQTSLQQAFYMLSFLLLVGKQQEENKPTVSLAV